MDKAPGWLLGGALSLCALGCCVGFLLVPLDAAQGGIHRIIYIHVPSTWLALALFGSLAVSAGAGLASQSKLGPMVVEAIAPTGALFAFLAFWTGSLWGKPVWGAWLVWDMRLVADVVLLAFFVAIAVVHIAFADARRADRLVAALALAGAAIVPLTLASVALWPTGHGSSALHLRQAAEVAPTMTLALVTVGAGFLCYAGAAVLIRLRCVILERGRPSAWVAPIPGAAG